MGVVFLVSATYQLTFVVSLFVLRDLGNYHVTPMICHRSIWLEEDRGGRWGRAARLADYIHFSILYFLKGNLAYCECGNSIQRNVRWEHLL